jgi:hypothetical protein
MPFLGELPYLEFGWRHDQMKANQDNLPLGLQDSHKFAALVLDVQFGYGVEGQLPDGVRVYPKWPSGILSDFWTKGLGEWQCESMEGADLILVKSKISERPDILDAEHTSLSTEISGYVWALMLMRARVVEAPRSIVGSASGGKVSLKRISNFATHLWPRTFPFIPVDDRQLRAATRLLATVTSLVHRKSHQRFLRGLKAIQRMWTEHDPLERLHFATRALDALALTEAGKGKAHFVTRCELFTGQTNWSQKFLTDLYSRRNEIVHMHTVAIQTVTGESQSEANDRVNAESVEAEVVAVEAYRRILSKPRMLLAFTDEASIKSFWALDHASQRRLFGSPISPKRLAASSRRRILHRMGHR